MYYLKVYKVHVFTKWLKSNDEVLKQERHTLIIIVLTS